MSGEIQASGSLSPQPPVVGNFSSECKTLGFAILIILGIGGLAAAGVGLAGFGVQQGWWQAGAFSQMGQVNALIMMGVGGGGGVLCLTLGIIAFVKSHQNSHTDKVNSSPKEKSHAPQPRDVLQDFVAKQQSIKTLNGSIFGPEVYRIWDAEVVGGVNEMSDFFKSGGGKDPFFNGDFSETFCRLYIPEKIRWRGQLLDFTLNTLELISETPQRSTCEEWSRPDSFRGRAIMRQVVMKRTFGGKPFDLFQDAVKKEFGDKTLVPGWRGVSKAEIPNSLSKGYNEKRAMIEAQEDYRLPHALEIAVLMKLTADLKDVKLYEHHTTSCVEMIDGCEVGIGHYSEYGFSILRSGGEPHPHHGVGAVMMDIPPN